MEDKERWFVYKGKRHSFLTNGNTYRASAFYGTTHISLDNDCGETSIIPISDTIETVVDSYEISGSSLEDNITEDIEMLEVKDYEAYKTKIENFLSVNDITIDQIDFLLDEWLEVDWLMKNYQCT